MLLTLVLALQPGVLLAEPTHAGAKALESRLYAPCCYNGTLDVHASELARELRVEIEQRLEKGESSEVIQADFVERYGEKVLAARSDAPIRRMGVLVVLATLIVAGFLVRALRRWRRSNDADPTLLGERPRDDLDGRIDDELARLDG